MFTRGGVGKLEGPGQAGHARPPAPGHQYQVAAVGGPGPGNEARVAAHSYASLLPVKIKNRSKKKSIVARGLVDTGNSYRSCMSPEVAEGLGYHLADLKPLTHPVRLCTADRNTPLKVR